MWKVMVVTFGFLGWGFYVLSGGSDFEPPAPKARVAAALSTYEAPTQTVSPAADQDTSQTLAITAAAGAALNGSTTSLGSSVISLSDIQTDTTSNGVEILTASTSALTPTQSEPAFNADMRQIKGNRVNIRNGPSTDFDVLDRLSQGDEVEVLQSPGDGWVKLRIAATGQIGWVAERLLTAKTN